MENLAADGTPLLIKDNMCTARDVAGHIYVKAIDGTWHSSTDKTREVYTTDTTFNPISGKAEGA
jgi:hypothetical protein